MAIGGGLPFYAYFPVSFEPVEHCVNHIGFILEGILECPRCPSALLGFWKVLLQDFGYGLVELVPNFLLLFMLEAHKLAALNAMEKEGITEVFV